MRKLKIIIAEDEPFVAQHLGQIITKAGYSFEGMAHSKKELFELLENTNPDLVLLDIRMETEKTGFEIATELNKTSIPFLFISAHSDDETLTTATNLNPLAYIVKPFNENQVKASLKNAETKIQNDGKSIFNFKSGHTEIRINKRDIIYIKSENIYCDIYTTYKRYVLRISLSHLIGELESNFIKRIHRSYAVNEARITEFGTNYVMIENVKIPLGKTHGLSKD